MRSTAWAPVVVLVVLAPWSAEMAWGGFPVTLILPILLFLAPVYGGAALLIREAARRTGRGWPTILLLAAAFGVLQAGVVDQSLFNPAYGRYDFQQPVHVPGIDVSLYYLVAFVAGHVVASIAVPIAIAECWSHRRTEPWLPPRVLGVVGVVYVLAWVVNHVGVKEDEGHGFQATPLQTVAAIAVALVLAVGAWRWPPRAARPTRVPPPWALGVLGFTAYLLYLPGEGAAALAVAAVVIGAVVVVVGTWSRSSRWTTHHTVALGLGAFLVGLVAPFLNAPYEPGDRGRELVSDLVAAGVCLAVVAATLARRAAYRLAR